MSKFLVILPVSIAGTLIMKGFANGLRSCGFLTVEKDVREITLDELLQLNISTIIGYDYGYLHNEELANYIKKNPNKFKLVNYFADEPNSAFANAVGNNLYEQLKELNPFVFVWDSTYLDKFEKSWYLPLAINPKLYQTDFEDLIYNITFVGRPSGEKRQKILSTVSKVYGGKLKIFSYEKHFYKALEEMIEKQLLSHKEAEIFKNSYCGFVKTEKEMAEIYSRSAINLNITIQGENNLNYRVFEVLGSGGFLLTDYQKDLDTFFVVSKDLETYTNETELIDKIDFYLKNTSIGRRIGIRGYEKILKRHTFIDRVRTILAIVEKK